MKKAKKPKPHMVRVGVDFGTTHSVAALSDRGNYPILGLPFEYQGEALRADHVPTCITRLEDRLYYGPAAVQAYLDHYRDGAVFVSSLKRLLQEWREGQSLRLGDRDYPVLDLLIGFLSEFRRGILAALDAHNIRIEAVIAVPANASSSQRFATISSFREAGFNILKILDEPVASGIQFVHERYKRRDQVRTDVVIYDLGGGTFDTTLLSIDRGSYDPVLSRGISRLGGDDFDEVLLELVEEDLGRTFEGEQRLRMLREARRVKESIGPHSQKLHVETPEGAAVVIPMKRFLDASLPLVDRSIDLAEQVLAEARSRFDPDKPEVDRIVMVGGGSLMHLVSRRLRERFGRAKIHIGLYPFASVAIGAAIQAESPDLVVHDRLTNHFGVLRVREDGSEYVDVIFEKGRKLPTANTVDMVARPEYDPRHDIGHFRYLECDGVDPATGLPTGDPVYWNDVFFPYDRAINPNGDLPAGMSASDIRKVDHLRDERIIEEYYLDKYGIVTARIRRAVQDQFSNCYNLFRKT